MTSTRKETKKHLVPIEAAMTGILALLVDVRERACADDKSAVKAEVLLSTAGMSIDDISAVTGKKYDTVRMTIRRGRAK